MDNVCHTLVGAALGESGLKSRTRFGNPALMIAANLPDIDALGFVFGMPLVAFRRGWTHGVLAQALLPIAFTLLVVMIDRWRPPRRQGAPRARVGALLVLSYLGVLSHVGLDLLNTYGVRLLMPFSDRWFYGDAVFIIDPWLWLMLGTGVVLARRLARVDAARAAVMLAIIYIAVMVGSARAARGIVQAEWRSGSRGTPRALMAGPAPINPLRKSIIVRAGEGYVTGTFQWWPLEVRFDPALVPSNEEHPAAVRASHTPVFRPILTWARFPHYEVEPVEAGTRVTLSDMRFGPRIGSASVIVPR
jgi:inner membrane protein